MSKGAQRQRQWPLLSMVTTCTLLLLILAVASCSAQHEHSEGCGCARHRAALAAQAVSEEQQQAEEALVDADPTNMDTNHPPDIHNGISRYIPDPNAVKPEYWNDQDDGPWEADMIDNPEYKWARAAHSVPAVPTYWSKLVAEVEEALPWVTLGVLLVATLSIIPLPLDTLKRHLTGNNNGPFATCKAAIIGLATPLCSCGSLPIAAGFLEAGIPLSSVVAFLTAAQSAGLDSAAITFGLLGPMAAMCRICGALILAVVAGTALASTSSTSKRQNSSDEKRSNSNGVNGVHQKSAAPGANAVGIVSKFMTEAIDTATEIMPLVVIGLAISTAAVHFMPKLTLPLEASMADHHAIVAKFLARVGVLASALPLQLCEHTTAALAAGIQKAGGSAGLAFAFLLSAPATNLPSLLLLTRTSGSYDRFTALKVASALSGTALLLSYAIDFAGVDLLVVKEAESDTGEMAALPRSFVAASPWIAGFLISAGILRTIKKKLSKRQDHVCCAPAASCDIKSLTNKKHD